MSEIVCSHCGGAVENSVCVHCGTRISKQPKRFLNQINDILNSCANDRKSNKSLSDTKKRLEDVLKNIPSDNASLRYDCLEQIFLCEYSVINENNYPFKFASLGTDSPFIKKGDGSAYQRIVELLPHVDGQRSTHFEELSNGIQNYFDEYEKAKKSAKNGPYEVIALNQALMYKNNGFYINAKSIYFVASNDKYDASANYATHTAPLMVAYVDRFVLENQYLKDVMLRFAREKNKRLVLVLDGVSLSEFKTEYSEAYKEFEEQNIYKPIKVGVPTAAKEFSDNVTDALRVSIGSEFRDSKTMEEAKKNFYKLERDFKIIKGILEHPWLGVGSTYKEGKYTVCRGYIGIQYKIERIEVKLSELTGWGYSYESIRKAVGPDVIIDGKILRRDYLDVYREKLKQLLLSQMKKREELFVSVSDSGDFDTWNNDVTFKNKIENQKNAYDDLDKCSISVTSADLKYTGKIQFKNFLTKATKKMQELERSSEQEQSKLLGQLIVSENEFERTLRIMEEGRANDKLANEIFTKHKGKLEAYLKKYRDTIGLEYPTVRAVENAFERSKGDGEKRKKETNAQHELDNLRRIGEWIQADVDKLFSNEYVNEPNLNKNVNEYVNALNAFINVHGTKALYTLKYKSEQQLRDSVNAGMKSKRQVSDFDKLYRLHESVKRHFDKVLVENKTIYDMQEFNKCVNDYEKALTSYIKNYGYVSQVYKIGGVAYTMTYYTVDYLKSTKTRVLDKNTKMKNANTFRAPSKKTKNKDWWK